MVPGQLQAAFVDALRAQRVLVSPLFSPAAPAIAVTQSTGKEFHRKSHGKVIHLSAIKKKKPEARG